MMMRNTWTALCLLLLSSSAVTGEKGKKQTSYTKQISICIKNCEEESNRQPDPNAPPSLPGPGAPLGSPLTAAPVVIQEALPDDNTTIVGVARLDPRFLNLTNTLDAVGLSFGLQQKGPFTVFAPTNDAFFNVTKGTPVAKWLTNVELWRPQVIDLLSHHVVEDELYMLDLKQMDVGTELYTAQGTPITITSTYPTVEVNGILLNETVDEIFLDGTVIMNETDTDIMGSNGVAHAIEELLVPPSASQTLIELLRDMPFMSTFVRLLDQADLLQFQQIDGPKTLLEYLEGEGPFTILAPTNEAFESVSEVTLSLWESDPQELLANLLFHIAPGNFREEDLQWVQGVEAPITRLSQETAPVRVRDILVGDTLTSNGILHMVDRVQKVPPTLAPTPAPAPNSLVGIMRGRGEFNMLLDALEETDRLRDLSVNSPLQPFTVFAPRDSSIVRDLPTKFLEKQWETHLINVLTYHIVEGNMRQSNFTVVGQRLATLNFNALEVTSLNPPRINNVAILETIQADNGVIHVIDQMLLPPSATNYVVDLYALFPEFRVLLDRIGAAGLTTTLRGEGPMTVLSPVEGAFRNLLNRDIYRIDDIQIWKEILEYHIIPGQLINYAALVEEYTPEITLPPRPSGLLVQDAELDPATQAMIANMTANVTVVPPPLHTFEVTTLQGSTLKLSVQPNNVGPASILFEDLLVLNGVVQVIDEVLIPPNVTIPLSPVYNPQPVGPDDNEEDVPAGPQEVQQPVMANERDPGFGRLLEETTHHIWG